MHRDAIRGICCSALALTMSTMCLAQTTPASASPATPASQGTTQEMPSGPAAVLKVTTRMVVVDVVVKTNKGDVVKDLKAEDFTLTEDGKQQEIKSVTFQQGDNDTRPQIATLPAGTFTNQLGTGLLAPST